MSWRVWDAKCSKLWGAANSDPAGASLTQSALISLRPETSIIELSRSSHSDRPRATDGNLSWHFLKVA